MIAPYQFKPMPTATDRLEPWSDEWVENMSMRLRHRVQNTEKYGIEELIEAASKLFEAGKEWPWDLFPPKHKGGPIKRADLYFQMVCQKPWPYIRALIEMGDKQLAARIDAEVNPGKGDNQYTSVEGVNNINTHTPPKGTSRSYTLNRLKRDHEELFERVVAGELSANAAAIEAGFRQRTVTVPITVEGALRLLSKLTAPEREEVRRLLNETLF